MEELYMRKAETDGYFTVEAACIVPMTVVIIAMFIYLAFFMYDRCTLDQDSYVLSYRESVRRGGKSTDTRSVLGQKYFMVKGFSAGFSGGSEISFAGEAKLATAFGKGNSVIRFGQKARKSDPPGSFRKFRRSAEIITGGWRKQKKRE